MKESITRLLRLGAYCVFSTIGTVLFFRTATAQPASDTSKFSPATKSLISRIAPDESRQYWLYLDSSVVDPDALVLTEKARERRAKVDPAGLLVDWKDYPIDNSVLIDIRDQDLHVVRISRWLKAVVVDADMSGLAKASRMPFVRRIEPSRTLVAILDPNLMRSKPPPTRLETADFDYGLSGFQIDFMNARRLHQAGLTGAGVTLGVFDTGFNTSHPAFDSANIIATYDFIWDDTSVDERDCPSAGSTDQTYHGTPVFSMLAGYVPDTLIGVAPDADYVLAKTEISCDGIEVKMEEYNWVAAAEWADSIGVDIISSSVGYVWFTDSGSYSPDQLDGNTAVITIAADIAASKNILVVSSAGNERLGTWGHIIFPADGDSVLAVGAAKPDSTLADFSSPGPTSDGRIKPDITNLGVSVYGASHLGGYYYWAGTSFAAPITAGAAALAMQRDPTVSANTLLGRIRETASRANFPDNDFGYGLLNATRAANLMIEFDLARVIQIRYDCDTSIDVSVVRWDGPTPCLTAINLPPWATFTDNGDGTGTLVISPDINSLPRWDFKLAGSADSFSDTADYQLQVYGMLEQAVTAAPNPFEDIVYVYVRPAAGNVRSISFFNSAGEIVWEKVNNFPLNADALTVLQEEWNGRNQSGRIVAGGVYVLVVSTDRQTFRIKLLKTN